MMSDSNTQSTRRMTTEEMLETSAVLEDGGTLEADNNKKRQLRKRACPLESEDDKRGIHKKQRQDGVQETGQQTAPASDKLKRKRKRESPFESEDAISKKQRQDGVQETGERRAPVHSFPMQNLANIERQGSSGPLPESMIEGVTIRFQSGLTICLPLAIILKKLIDV